MLEGLPSDGQRGFVVLPSGAAIAASLLQFAEKAEHCSGLGVLFAADHLRQRQRPYQERPGSRKVALAHQDRAHGGHRSGDVGVFFSPQGLPFFKRTARVPGRLVEVRRGSVEKDIGQVVQNPSPFGRSIALFEHGKAFLERRSRLLQPARRTVGHRQIVERLPMKLRRVRV